MFCGSCGSQIPDNVRFCATCGAPVEQTAAPAQGSGPAAAASGPPPAPQPRAQYIPPGQPASPPPSGPNRAGMWAGLAVAALIVIAAAIAIPLLLRNSGGDTSSSSVATAGSSTVVSGTTATSATAPSTTAPAAGPVGDSSGAWVEVPVPGGPWAANEVAVSDDAILIQTNTAGGVRLSAVMLGTGDVITLTEAEAQWGLDIDGLLAVWWEGAAWDDATERYTEQYIYSYLLPAGPRTLIAAGGGDTMMMPQVARPWVTWVVGAPWADDPTEYWSERIMYARVDDSGSPVGAMGELVPSALAFVLGDSGWQYSLSSTRVAWEHAETAEGYDVGSHVMGMDLAGHQWIGGDAWRPTLSGDVLVYWDDGLKMTDLVAGTTRDIDPSGDFATAGPTFAAYYRPSEAGSQVVARGYGGAYEQILGELALPPYWCPVISVSPHHIAFAADTVMHVFEWQAH
jgi:hypothetical protein